MEEKAPSNLVLEDIKLQLTLTYLKARRPALNQELEGERRALKQLSLADKRAETLLNDFAERLERGFSIGKIIPNNAITLRRLYLEHRRVRAAYNEAAKRFEGKLKSHGSEAQRECIYAALREFGRRLNQLTNAPAEKPKLKLVPEVPRTRQRLKF